MRFEVDSIPNEGFDEALERRIQAHFRARLSDCSSRDPILQLVP